MSKLKCGDEQLNWFMLLYASSHLQDDRRHTHFLYCSSQVRDRKVTFKIMDWIEKRERERDEQCSKFLDCQECVAKLDERFGHFRCTWNLRNHECFNHDPKMPWGGMAKFEHQCPADDSIWGKDGEAEIHVALIVCILFPIAVVIVGLLCAFRHRRRRRWRNTQQVTTGQVMTVRTQPVPQPRSVIAMPMNTVHPQRPQYQSHPQVGQMQYQPNRPQYQSNPPQMGPAPMMQHVPSAPPASLGYGAEGV